jgi:flagellin
MERLSTGKRINYAKDDAAGQAVATRLTAEIQGLAMASRNAADGQSLIDTADGALAESHTLLLRMRELAVQSANGTLQTSDRTAFGVEFDALEAEITRISDNTTWAGQKMLDSSLSTGIKIHVGPGNDQTQTHLIPNMAASAVTIGITAAIAITDVTKANSAITQLDLAIAGVAKERGKLGSTSNRLDSTVANLNQVKVNLSASRGRIEDADFAQETGNLAKNQILQQAAMAMVAQANASKGSILTLIRN